jgi:hypothetical protein
MPRKVGRSQKALKIHVSKMFHTLEPFFPLQTVQNQEKIELLLTVCITHRRKMICCLQIKEREWNA